MDTQFKKGVLELIVLSTLLNKDMYGYELVLKVSQVVDVNEGTIYPLLKRLTNDKYFETYLVESNEGPPRKYYRITDFGKTREKELRKAWKSFAASVNKFLEGEKK